MKTYPRNAEHVWNTLAMSLRGAEKCFVEMIEMAEKFISKILGKGIRMAIYPCGHSYSVEKGSGGGRMHLKILTRCEAGDTNSIKIKI